MTKESIGIAMSGGVDSTVCALLLQKKYRVHGFFMQLAQPDLAEQIAEVRQVADRCGIPLTIIDLQSRFAEKVLNYFSVSYRSGRTPNPCMICNREIKFGLFLDAILEQGMTRMATGHYANIVDDHGCRFLQQGKDTAKDQSYFLARLSQQQLARVLFPLGNMNKDAVYNLAEEHGFMDFRGRESQDVCFLGTDSVGSFLETHTSETAPGGDIVSSDGCVLGQHRGICHYTIGQRRGLGISDTTPWYVTAIDARHNRIVVGKNEDLLQREVEIRDVLWNTTPPETKQSYRVRIRYGHQGAEARIEMLPENHCRITFSEKQRAVTPGQFAVIYQQNSVIGSGEIL